MCMKNTALRLVSYSTQLCLVLYQPLYFPYTHSSALTIMHVFDMYLFTLNVAVPTPSVTVTTPNTQTVGQPLTLTCNATTVRGITSRVDFVWRRGSMVLIRRSNTSPIVEDSSLIFTNTYSISQLNTTDDGRVYQCEVVINSIPSVTATNSLTLEVMGRLCLVGF